MRNPAEIIIRPIITEKTNRLMEDYNQYTFEVKKDANKIEIKYAIEKLFNVKVLDVKTLPGRPRKKRVTTKIREYGTTRSYKKAIVCVDKTQKIDLLSI